MSTTEIFGVKADGDVVKVGETPDAMRGAMYIWGRLAKTYDKGTFKDFMPLWELCDTEVMKPVHSLVLKTTFDDVVVMKEDIPAILDAFAEFDREFPGGSLAEQASIVRREIFEQEDMIGVCWNQTSGIKNAWKVQTDDGQYIPYNIYKHENHFVV